MIYLNDYERGGVWLNKFHIATIDQQIRDCKVTLIDGSIFYTLETDKEIIAKINNYDL
jgi:uncharacterized protein YlzI (FlbEa/FlbD family)|tara:strand:+ start:861 stop:1034 length:174 start_codon:yes stop_codon:yes gene_type:complete